jgi:hypothetical protein
LHGRFETLLQLLRREGEAQDIEQSNGLSGLLLKVQAKVGFVHGRGRVPAHGRVAIEAVDFGGAAAAGEEVAEEAVAPQGGGSDDHWHIFGGEGLHADINYPADAADGGGRIECGAGFVVDDRRA